jgi:hypothetical protein
MSPALTSPHVSDEHLDDYVDEVLNAPDREAVRVHVGACAECAERLDELRELLARSTAERRPVAPPAELWPFVVASTIARVRVRRQVLRSMRASLAIAAVVLVALSSATTAWVMRRVSTSESTGAVSGVPSLSLALDEDVALARALAARDREQGPVSRERINELRQRLRAADADLRRASSDEALFRALAEREGVVADIRGVLGRGPRAPRAPIPGRAP